MKFIYCLLISCLLLTGCTIRYGGYPGYPIPPKREWKDYKPKTKNSTWVYHQTGFKLVDCGYDGFYLKKGQKRNPDPACNPIVEEK